MIKIILLVCSAALAAADADALYGAYGYAGHLGYAAGHLGYAAPVHHVTHGVPVHHVAHAAPVHHVAHAASVHHVAHAAPVHHVAHAVPVHHAVGYGVSNVANTVGIHGVAPAAVPAVHGAYAGAGRYVANSAGTVHVAKREADSEPEADADALYHGYGYHGLYGHGLGHRTYSLGYGHGIRHGYSALHHGYGLGYARHGYYGKRSADAEPEADADALYASYGHGLYGHGYGLGHRTYSLGYGHGYGLRHGYSALHHGYGYGHGYGYYG